MSTSLCWLQSRRGAADRLYRGPTSARGDVRARRAAARPAGACAHHGGDSLCSIMRERHLAAWREAAASTVSTSRRSALPAWRPARPERGLRRRGGRALPRRRGTLSRACGAVRIWVRARALSTSTAQKRSILCVGISARLYGTIATYFAGKHFTHGLCELCRGGPSYQTPAHAVCYDHFESR